MRKFKLTVREMTLFAMYAALMLVSKLLMQSLPNVHLIGMFTVLLTVVYRKKALIPIYLFVLLNGLVSGFTPFLIPYVYVWAVLWGVAMLLPKNLSYKTASVVYPLVCALHGFSFGLLYAPFQALAFGMYGKALWAWIIAGRGFDISHGIGNFVLGFLVYPLSKLLLRMEKQYRR